MTTVVIQTELGVTQIGLVVVRLLQIRLLVIITVVIDVHRQFALKCFGESVRIVEVRRVLRRLYAVLRFSRTINRIGLSVDICRITTGHDLLVHIHIGHL